MPLPTNLMKNLGRSMLAGQGAGLFYNATHEDEMPLWQRGLLGAGAFGLGRVPRFAPGMDKLTRGLQAPAALATGVDLMSRRNLGYSPLSASSTREHVEKSIFEKGRSAVEASLDSLFPTNGLQKLSRKQIWDRMMLRMKMKQMASQFGKATGASS